MSRLQEQEWQHQNPALAFPMDSLYCSEEHWEEEKEEEEEEDGFSYLCYDGYTNNGVVLNPPFTLLEQDMYWDQEELISLSSKQESNPLCNKMEHEHLVSSARREAVEWMMKVHAHYGFCALTGVLAVNYLDRFLSSFDLRSDNKPWMSQLTAVACLSLAAKVEETEVPLLLDLQVEETRYMFEAKAIQKMELVVLSSLQWKMNPVTPLSFIDHFVRRFGLKDNLCWDFLRSCENILLYVISDSRSTSYLPSVLSTGVMLHVANTIDPSLESEFQTQLFNMLPISKDILDACLEVISDAVSRSYRYQFSNKRKFGSYSIPGSPDGVIDVCFSSDDVSNDSWAVAGSSVSSSPQPQQQQQPPLSKKIKASSEDELELMQGQNHPTAEFL